MPLDIMTKQGILALATAKGVIMAFIILAVAETTFIQGILTAILSACVSGSFLLISVHMTTKKTQDKVDEVAAKVEDAKKVLEEKNGS